MANLFLTGTGTPTGATGEISDYYRDLATNLIYYHNTGGWEAVLSLIPTPDGVGTNWLFGTGAPSNGIGATNDYYRDDANGSVYRKHAANGWEAKGSLDFIGVYGVQWGEGSGAPANIPPLNNLPAGSFYLNVANSDIYYKDSTLTWSLKGQLGGGGASSINVIDNLLSTSATDALSANQGNVIFTSVQFMYTQFGNSIDDIYTTLSSYGDIVTHNASEFITSDTLATSLTAKADLVGGFVPANQLPGFVDDILEYADLASFPVTGETGKLYVALDSNLVYRWTGSTYAVTSSSLALGETSATAYRGDRGATAYNHSQATGNPHGTAISDIIGLQTAIDNAAVNFATATVNSQTGTAYTLGTVNTDNDGKTYLRMTNASANTVTIPSTQTKPISISQRGAGITTLVAGAGVTLNGILIFDAQHQTKTVIPLGGNIFDVVG